LSQPLESTPAPLAGDQDESIGILVDLVSEIGEIPVV
jgi:hypothetical protein